MKVDNNSRPYDSYTVSQTAETSATKVAEAPASSQTQAGVVYEQSSPAQNAAPATYTLNKMSKEDRASFAQALKDKQAEMKQNFLNIIQKSLNGQAKAYSIAMNDDSMWQAIANGDFVASATDIAQAKKDISEDGYYGVKQTAQRLFDFASALAGDDVDKMKQLQSAMEKGFKKATGSWGKELPSICDDTLKKANELFEDYYKSKEQ